MRAVLLKGRICRGNGFPAGAGAGVVYRGHAVCPVPRRDETNDDIGA